MSNASPYAEKAPIDRAVDLVFEGGSGGGRVNFSLCERVAKEFVRIRDEARRDGLQEALHICESAGPGGIEGAMVLIRNAASLNLEPITPEQALAIAKRSSVPRPASR